MINKQELIKFLLEAKKNTYALWNKSKSIKEKDFSTTLVYEKWNYKYHDNYFGWEPFVWREVVFYKNKPIFMMTYYGFVENKAEDTSKIYSFLQNALKLVSEDFPFRWPKNYQENDLIYKNNFYWKLDRFHWIEKIFLNNKKIYEARYMWGFVDL